ncbi:RidA family protein [Advenella incenata]|jgi:reactive intermediate/imine deaminase
MSKIKLIHRHSVIEGMSMPGGHYAHTVVADGLVFISGQLPINESGEPCTYLGFAEQTELAMKNVATALQAAQCDWRHVLKITAYITDVDNWPLFNKVYATYVGEFKPARTVVPVPALHFGALIEIEAIALRNGDSASR